MPDDQRQQMEQRFEAVLEEMSASGELVTGVALAAPAAATVLRWGAQGAVATDGPYAEAKEHLAGLFILDCETRERAEEVVTAFASPGDVVELRPAMVDGGDDG